MEVPKIEALGRLPRGEVRLEVDFFMFPAPVQDEGDRPYFPHMLLVVDAGSGMVLGSDLLTPYPSLAWNRLGKTCSTHLANELAGEVSILPESNVSGNPHVQVIIFEIRARNDLPSTVEVHFPHSTWREFFHSGGASDSYKVGFATGRLLHLVAKVLRDVYPA
jgi:hypothetical protein